MIWPVALAVGVVAAAGVYLALSRDLLRCVVGVALLGSATGLLLFAAGRLGSRVPPLIPAGQDAVAGAANPLPQALVLTAIVIGFALTCFSLVLLARLVQLLRSHDALDLRLAEPRDGEAGDP